MNLFSCRHFETRSTRLLISLSLSLKLQIKTFSIKQRLYDFATWLYLLYHNNKPWIKNDGNGEFDVTMGSYDGAEVCEVVGLFILDIIRKKYLKEKIGLYRDDGLSVFKNQTGHHNDKVRKELIRIFQYHHLKLEIKSVI